MALDWAKAEDAARRLHANAKDGTLKLNGSTYVFTFDRAAGVYAVTLDGAEVVRFNTRKITVARAWLRDYLGG